MMDEKNPKIRFALGDRVSAGNFFKSSYARSIVTSSRDAKSLDFMDNETNDPASDSNIFSNNKNNIFSSLIAFGTSGPRDDFNGPRSFPWQTFNEDPASHQDIGEMEKLRKQCQALTEENRKLAESLRVSQAQCVEAYDNVFLQTQVVTLEWQLKQTESNRQMYRSLMGEIVRFLDRARKSLDILHEKNNSKGKVSRVPRSHSVQGIDKKDESTEIKKREKDNTSTPVNNRPAGNSGGWKFTRAKSVAQISPQTSNTFRDFSWLIPRKTDSDKSTPTKNKTKQQPQQPQQTTSPAPAASPKENNQTHEGAVYKTPEYPSEIDPDSVPAEKLAQEAFRLMRIVQSLLGMREPDLAQVSSNEEEEMFNWMVSTELSSSPISNNTNFVNSGSLLYIEGCSLSERESTGSSGENSERGNDTKSSVNGLDNSTSSASTLRPTLPRGRQSIDTTSLNSNSTSSKTTEEEETEIRRTSTGFGASIVPTEPNSNVKLDVCPTSTPNRKVPVKIQKMEPTRWLRSKIRPKSSRSGSSVEDESGFSSMTSFQEVGLPLRSEKTALSPIKGCHTEVGLPEIPMDKVPRRRWSSTPAEFAAIFKKNSTSFTGRTSATPESVSVWV